MNDRPTHVLLVEDNPGDADLVRSRLVESEIPVDVSCVEKLADGLARMTQEPPTVVLLDLNLPDSRGADTFRKVLEKAPDVPIIILSDQDDEALAIQAVQHGVQDYLVKNEITCPRLQRSMRYAVERQALLRSLEIGRKQQQDFKNQFLSHISHELRTPLTCIHQFVTILLDGLAGDLNPEQRCHLRTVLKSVKQLGAMVRNLLEATRAETGKIVIEPRCVSIGELVQQGVALMKAAAREKQIGLEIGLDTRIPLAYCDPDRILEVLINLIDNGIKFTPSDGSVIVKASLVDLDPSVVYVSVADSGRGIAPEVIPLVFERLYQDPGAVDNNRKGLGLGLFISRELVRLHGGRMWVASEPGHGSTFSFTLPLYSLAKLLFPVITYQGSLREALVLVKVELKPLSTPPRGNWKQTCQKGLEILQRCVYLDKDLVLPPMTGACAHETFFVVASTDLERADIMMTRIREQLGKWEELQASGQVTISATPVPIPQREGDDSLEAQVQKVANCVTELILSALGLKHPSAGWEDQQNASTT